jgi:Mg-chelatase subunit ChlD
VWSSAHVFSVLLLAASVASGQVVPRGSVKPDEGLVAPRAAPVRAMPLEVVPAKRSFRLTDRVLFVVDVSGSMKAHLAQATASVLMIVQCPLDGFQVGLLTFSGENVRWKGKPKCKHPVPERHGRSCVLPGWASMPADYRPFVSYLNRCSAKGMTLAGPALLRAFQDPDPTLTIVFVSDGEFDLPSTLGAVKAGLAWRKAHKLPPAQIMVWGAGPDAKKSVELHALAKVGGGGLWIHGGKRSGPW